MAASICVFGAGAIGGFLAARLAAGGTQASIVARGAHLAAIQANGLTLEAKGKRLTVRPHAVSHGEVLGPQDYVFITVKSYALAAALPQLLPMLAAHTTIIPAMNGIPWWYAYALPPPFTDRRVTSVDPTGVLWASLPPRQCVGCIVNVAAEVVAPGVVRHDRGESLVLGEPDGTPSARVAAVSGLLQAAGLEAPAQAQFRAALWGKVAGSMAFNAISALTTATMDTIASDPGTCAVAGDLIRESEAVAAGFGISLPLSTAEQIRRWGAIGPHKTSMLQDLEHGRSLELDAVLGAVIELASWVSVPTPVAAAVLALARQRAATRPQHFQNSHPPAQSGLIR